MEDLPPTSPPSHVNSTIRIDSTPYRSHVTPQPVFPKYQNMEDEVIKYAKPQPPPPEPTTKVTIAVLNAPTIVDIL